MLISSPIIHADPISRTPQRLRVAATLGLTALLLTVIGIVFWVQDGRYSLPTPRPPSLRELPPGTAVVLPAGVDWQAGDRRPLLLHFFNPDCPCSRFNAEHVRALRTRFGAQIHFVAVVQILEDQDDARRRDGLAAAERLFGSGLEAVMDDGGKIAAACGVYSTPQAVILAPGSPRTLLFRGNYNASRYCADPRTEFVRKALEAIVGRQPLPPESRAAMIAYGCELPANVSPARPGPVNPRL